MQKRPLAVALTTLLALGANNIAVAAAPGNIGENGAASATSSDLTAEIAELTLISGLGDLDLGEWAGDTSDGLSASDKVCLWGNKNISDRVSHIVFKGDGTDGAFTLKNTATGSTETLAYTVSFAGPRYLANTQGGNVTTKNTEALFNCADAAEPDGSEYLYVDVSQSELQSSVAGIYKGTLTMTMTVQ